jgi:hypothetical protein
MGQTQGLKPHPAAFVPTLQGRSVRQAVCYNSGMDPLHATIEEFAAEVSRMSSAIALDAA